MISKLTHALLTACLLLSVMAWAGAQSLSPVFFQASAATAKHVVIITGPTVGQDNERKFHNWTLALHNILVRDYGYNAETITLLYDNGQHPVSPTQPDRASQSGRASQSDNASQSDDAPQSDDAAQSGRASRPDSTSPPGSASQSDRTPQPEREPPPINGPATRDGIWSSFAELSERVNVGDQITIFLIGHGSGAEDEAKFNIVGPDITGIQFAELLDDFQHQDLVIINTTSASYGFSTALSDEGRVVISATRSSTERYDPVFSRYFIEALAGRNGDRDKNNRVSMLEAFNYAKANVAQWYESRERLASEHAGLDDNGDTLFTLNPDSGEADGRLAEIAYIDTLRNEEQTLTPEALTLKAKMQELERDVFILRSRKSEFLEADYWQQMETLLVNLARTTNQFTAAENPE
ncbi:MAG: hypothetical protein ACR2PR_05780 [Pseudohongiellaceae bacterium]